jgi:hypothetical protein
MADFLKFWGTRSGVSLPDKGNAVSGGNTLCIQLESQKPVFINAGFGLALASEQLLKRRKGPYEVNIFLTDFARHHIEGLGFFTPIHFKSSRVVIHTPADSKTTVAKLNEMFNLDLSPFDGVESFQGKVEFATYTESTFNLAELAIDSLCFDPSDALTTGTKNAALRVSGKQSSCAVLLAKPNLPCKEAIKSFTATSQYLVHSIEGENGIIATSYNPYWSDTHLQKLKNELKDRLIFSSESNSPATLASIRSAS